MMQVKIYGKCETLLCNRRGFLIRQRTYDIPGVGKATSKTRMCRTCYRSVKALVRSQSQDAA